jgi:hypothetical protein
MRPIRKSKYIEVYGRNDQNYYHYYYFFFI